MELSSPPEVILTHESDLDGFVGGHLLQRLARHLFGTEVRLEAWNNQAWRQRPMKEAVAWVCDFAFDSRLDRPGWWVIDHHPAEAQARNARLIHQSNHCAAALSYDLCRQHGLATPALDRLVALTEVGDLFLEDSPDFEEAQDYAALLKTYPFWNLSRLIHGELESLIDHPLLEVIRTKRRVENPLGLAWSREHLTEIHTSLACVDVVLGNSNLILHELLRSPDCRYPVLATLMRKAGGPVVVSFRSRNGEALEIAQRLRGGGHPNACGATLPRSVSSVADAVEYLRQFLNPPPVKVPTRDDAPLVWGS